MKVYVLLHVTIDHSRYSAGNGTYVEGVYATEACVKTALDSIRAKIAEQGQLTIHEHREGYGFTIGGPPYWSFIPTSYSYIEKELIGDERQT